MGGKMRMLRGSARLSRRPDSTYCSGPILGGLTAGHHGLASLDEAALDHNCFETHYPHRHDRASFKSSFDTLLRHVRVVQWTLDIGPGPLTVSTALDQDGPAPPPNPDFRDD